MPSRLGGFTSKSNKMPQRLLHKAQVLTKMISLNPNLDFSQITQISQRGVGESSQRLGNEYGSLVVPATSKGGRVMRTSILRLQSFLPLRYLALSHDHEHNN
jgi:hypothetical protein